MIFIRWQMGDGEVNDVHTAHTIRAQELLDLYKALNTVTLWYGPSLALI